MPEIQSHQPIFSTTDRRLGIASLAGVGLSLMEPRAFWLGAAVCLFAAFLTIRSHSGELRTYLRKRRTKRRKPVKIPVSLYSAFFLLCFCLGTPVLLYFTRSDPLLDTGILSQSRYERFIGYFVQPPKFQIGPSGIFFSGADRFGQLLLPIFTRDELRVETFRGDIRVSSKMTNESGKLIAEIKNNEWKVAPPGTGAWDRNYNSHSLEVLDANGEVALQVTMLPGVVQIQGYWWRDWGAPNGMMKIYVLQDQRTKESQYVFSPPHPNDPIKIAPLFRYPSSLHPGELLE